MRLRISGFAQIESADFNFGDEGDLTILVGQQATGKSLALQWLKLVTDAPAVRRDWERYGTNWRANGDASRPLNQFFGEGIGSAWQQDRTRVLIDRRAVALNSLFHQARGRSAGEPVEKTYYIPAHRALLLSDGWPKRFEQHGIGTPYVAKLQSERLARWLGDIDGAVYPVERRLPNSLRRLFDACIFHGATVEIDRKAPQARLILRPGRRSTAIPFMSWTAGQREFIPLLLALYELMPSGGGSRMRRAGHHDIHTVILEEPELGLHPAALLAVCIAVLFLMERGYRVVISTHSPVVVDFAWALNSFSVAGRTGQRGLSSLLRSFGLGNESTALAKAVLHQQARTYYMGYAKPGQVHVKDISGLRADALDADERTWGHLLDYSVQVAEAVARLPMKWDA